VPSSIEKPGNARTDGKGEASSHGKGQASGLSAAEGATKRAMRRGANVHIQDEDQAPTGKNAGDERAATEAAESERHERGKARTVAGANG
jgi:hypothetical protein